MRDFKYLALIRSSEMPDLDQVRQDVHGIRAGGSMTWGIRSGTCVI